jgi:hypothetical protein
MAKHKKHDRTNGAFGETLVEPPRQESPATALPEALRSLADPAGVVREDAPATGSLILDDPAVSSDDLGKVVKVLDEDECARVADRIRTMQGKPLPDGFVSSIVKRAGGFDVAGYARVFYVRGS